MNVIAVRDEFDRLLFLVYITEGDYTTEYYVTDHNGYVTTHIVFS
jgi:hypothetical protein